MCRNTILARTIDAYGIYFQRTVRINQQRLYRNYQTTCLNNKKNLRQLVVTS